LPRRLKVISGERLVKTLVRAGFEIRRRSGSHVIMGKDRLMFTVPLHAELKKRALRRILRQAGMSREEFERLL
jgi:predicted RNA binding protein YcfA (HicA-like mRNA interferase family)